MRKKNKRSIILITYLTIENKKCFSINKAERIWSDLKIKLTGEGIQLYENIVQLKKEELNKSNFVFILVLPSIFINTVYSYFSFISTLI